MKELFAPYEIALILKHKGFNEPCLGYYDYTGILCITDGRYEHPMSDEILDCSNVTLKDYPTSCAAPVYQQILNWFRKKHGIQLFNDCTYYDGFHYGYKWIRSNGNYGEWWKDNDGESPDGWDTPEEALNEAIIETLKII